MIFYRAYDYFFATCIHIKIAITRKKYFIEFVIFVLASYSQRAMNFVLVPAFINTYIISLYCFYGIKLKVILN